MQAQFKKANNIDLSNNKISNIGKNFPVSLTHIVKLNLSKNLLKSLPENFGELVNLKHLDLYNNKIQTFPLSFGNLKKLEWLDVKGELNFKTVYLCVDVIYLVNFTIQDYDNNVIFSNLQSPQYKGYFVK